MRSQSLETTGLAAAFLIGQKAFRAIFPTRFCGDMFLKCSDLGILANPTHSSFGAAGWEDWLTKNEDRRLISSK
jgi:hypothetical protein